MLLLYVRPRVVKRLLSLAGAVIIMLSIVGRVVVQAAGTSGSGSGDPAWAAPNSVAVRRVSGLGSGKNQSNLLNNLDCTSMTYRSVGDSTMQNGCFTPTAFGMFDADNQTVIFNGTDEGVRLSTYGSGELLAPWPAALNLIQLNSVSTGGDHIGLYKNPVAALQDKRNFAGQLTGKQLAAPQDILLKDASGKPLIINSQTMAFSSSGSWLVVETLSGSFVRINLATLEMTAFAAAFGAQGSPGTLFKSQVAISDDGRYAAIYNAAAALFRIYDLTTCGSNVTSWQSSHCQSHDYWPFVNQHISALQSIRHVRFINDKLMSFEAISGSAPTSGVYELAPTDSIKSLTDYIGLGDSYTSGEGAFDYLTGTDTVSNKCHVSAHAYPLLLTRDLFSEAGGHSVACSGAVINDLSSTSGGYRGQVKNGASLTELENNPEVLDDIQADFSAGYIAQHWFVGQYQPRVVTVSIGGNDIGFGDLLQNCVEPHISRHTSDQTCYNTFESRQEVAQLVDRTVPRWTALYRQLLAEDPGVQLYAIGYPSIASDTGACGLNVALGKSELEFAEELIAYLNGAIHQAADAANVPYADISQALHGHRLCEASGNAVAVNGLTAGNDSGFLGINVLGRESYHPNALGHELIEQAILHQTASLTSDMSATHTSDTSQNLLNAPKSGAPISQLVPDDTIASPLWHMAGNNTVRANGVRDGLKPSSTYTIRLDGSNGASLGTVVSDSNGDIAADIDLPADTAPGGHTIDITGNNQTDQPIDITQPIYVTSSSADSDGDGIVDDKDSCRYVTNSGQDADHDGIDDICDTIIGQSSGDTASTGQPSDRVQLGSARGLNSRPAKLTASTASFKGASESSNAPPQSALQRTNTSDSPAKPSPSPTPRKVLARSVTRKPQGLESRRRDWFLLRLMALGVISLACTLSGIFLAPLLIKRKGNLNTFESWLRDCVQIIYEKCRLCSTIVFMRKFGVFLLSVVLFVSLLGLASSTSSNIAFTNPSKVESWLNQSNLYGNFVSNAIDQAQQADGDGSSNISLSDPAIQRIAQSTFSSQLLQKDVNAFVDSNYAWLKGKNATPNFRIDLTSAKQTFAQRAGDYVEVRLKNLSVCSDTQLSELSSQTANPLTLPCRPVGVIPATVAAQVTDTIANSDKFLSDPTITASNLNPKGDSETRPYYQSLSGLPKVYQFGTKLPWIAAAVALASTVGIIFISKRHRNGVRSVGIVLLLASLVLFITKLLSDQIFDKVHHQVFDGHNADQLQKALTTFMHHAENQLVKIELWFGIAYLLLAVIIAIILRSTRQRQPASSPISDRSTAPTAKPQPAPVTPEAPRDVQLKQPLPNARPVQPKPRRPKPPRLIQ